MSFMIENEGILIDSNILIYAFDKDEKEKNLIAKDILERVANKEIDIFLSTQNLSEFYYNVIKKIKEPLEATEAKEIIYELISLSNVNVLKIAENNILSAINLSIEYGISYWDALIVSVMKENNIYSIITENEKDFKKIKWLKVVNPFS